MTLRVMGSRSKKKSFLLRVEEETLESLRTEAKVQGISLSQLLRDVLNRHVSAKQTAPAPAVYRDPRKPRKKNWWE